MLWRDRYGHYIQYGDYVEDLDKRYIGQVVRSSVGGAPVLHVIKKFSYCRMQYELMDNHAADVCYEREFLPKYNKIQQIFHGSYLPNIELIQHGERNRRVKEI